MLEARAAASRPELPTQHVGTLLMLGQYAHTFDEDPGSPFTTTAIGQAPYGYELLATLLNQEGMSTQGWGAFHEDVRSQLSMTTMGQAVFAHKSLAGLSNGLQHFTLVG